MVSIYRNQRITQETKICLATHPTASCVLIFVFQSLFLKINYIFTAPYYVKYYVTSLVPYYFPFSQVPSSCDHNFELGYFAW